MPGGAPLGKSVGEGLKRIKFSADMVRARERYGQEVEKARTKSSAKSTRAARAAEKKALAAQKKAERAAASAEKKRLAAEAKAAKSRAKSGGVLENIGSAFVGAKLTGRGTQAGRLTKKAASVLRAQVGKAAGTAARLAKAGKKVPVRTAALAAMRGPAGVAVTVGAAGALAAKKKYDKELKKFLGKAAQATRGPVANTPSGR